jgi:prepilin-type N-terminal cleavage/methylation domain-containing protein
MTCDTMLVTGESPMKNFHRTNEAGFTLLELLVVIAVLVALAGGVVLALGDVMNESASQVARTEMLEIKNALLRFRADTGFLPRQGPFELVDTDPTDPMDTCIPSAAIGSVPLPAAGRAWFCSPANMDALYTNPLSGTGHPLETWQPDTARGWRGPYLTQQGEGRVDVGDNLLSDGTGSPVAGTVLSEMRGVADPFVGDPVVVGPDTYLAWRIAPTLPSHPRWGRPYFLFDLDDQGVSDSKEARIVGMGPDGTYAGVNATDFCVPPPGSDDLVLCLFK